MLTALRSLRLLAERIEPIGASQAAAAALALAVSCSVDAAPAAASKQEIRALLPKAQHQAIFCGLPGTETSDEYSAALSKALDTLLQRGQATTVKDAMEMLHKALCTRP